jgi:hypothetical protein
VINILRAFCFASLLTASFSTHAAVVFLQSGRWSELYAQNVVNAGTHIIITGNVTLDSPILIEGSIEISKGATFSGFKSLYITSSGILKNEGSIVLKSLLNTGQIINNGIIDLMYDLENEGTLQNNHLINCARSFYCNSGALTGGNSQYYVAEFYRISGIVSIETKELFIKMPEGY